MNNVDYIIVGQGIAGTTLAYRMMRMGLDIVVYDPCLPSSSSQVAAGIVNPITGRKLVKSWMIDELLPEARAVYSGMEELLNRKFLHAMPIYKLLQTPGDENDWLARRNDDNWLPYMSTVTRRNWKGVKCDAGVGTILNGYWLDIDQLILAFRDHFRQCGVLVKEAFSIDEMDIVDDGIAYKGNKAKAVIFCEGYKGMENPYFEGLPLSYAKGEIMNIRCPELEWLDGILNRNGFIIPLGGGEFKVGATFQWQDLSPGPTESGKADLVSRLDRLISLEYEILDIKAGFRPTMKDRRPVLGALSDNPRIQIFNGLGTKGVSLSAYFSGHLVNHLVNGDSLIPEADVRRFF